MRKNFLDCGHYECDNEDIKNWKECSAHDSLLMFVITKCDNCDYYEKNPEKYTGIYYTPEDRRLYYYDRADDDAKALFEKIQCNLQRELFLLCVKYEGKYCCNCMLEFEGEYDDEMEGLDIKEPAI